jgi:steroid delta-isomerase-like uncharacterized protein
MKHLLALLAISSVLLSSCMKKEGTTSMEASMKAADSVKNYNINGYRAVTDMFNTGKFDDLGKYVADNNIEHQMMPGQKSGLAGLKETITNFRAAFPDLKFTIDHITADSNMIWAHYTMTGTNTGPMMGMPPTGKSINIQGMDLVRLENGKGVEHWGYNEGRKMMEQLGLMPPMGGPPEAGKIPAEMKKSK